MSEPCLRCPCAATCLRHPAFCAWAAEVPADPVKLRHIRDRAAGGADRPSASTAPTAEARAYDASWLPRPCGGCP